MRDFFFFRQQAKCLLTFMEAVSDKTLRSTVALTVR